MKLNIDRLILKKQLKTVNKQSRRKPAFLLKSFEKTVDIFIVICYNEYSERQEKTNKGDRKNV